MQNAQKSTDKETKRPANEVQEAALRPESVSTTTERENEQTVIDVATGVGETAAVSQSSETSGATAYESNPMGNASTSVIYENSGPPTERPIILSAEQQAELAATLSGRSEDEEAKAAARAAQEAAAPAFAESVAQVPSMAGENHPADVHTDAEAAAMLADIIGLQN